MTPMLNSQRVWRREVITIVSGGTYTGFFVVKDNVLGKPRLGKIDIDGKAWWISCPRRVHHGLVVGYVRGHEVLVRYRR